MTNPKKKSRTGFYLCTLIVGLMVLSICWKIQSIEARQQVVEEALRDFIAQDDMKLEELSGNLEAFEIFVLTKQMHPLTNNDPWKKKRSRRP